MDLTTQSTPALLLDINILKRNIANMAIRARRLGVALRPHIKTHKCLEVARLQRESGARGITVSTLTEGEIFAGAGFNDITYAVPLEPGKIQRALALASQVNLGITVDDLALVDMLDRAAGVEGQRLKTWLKVDGGYHRAGVDPTSVYALQLAQAIAGAEHLDFAGLLTHAGHAYKAAAVSEIQAIAHEERRILNRFAAQLRTEGVKVPVLSVGATPTMAVATDLEGIDEARPGNYVFHDRTQLALGSCQPEDCALTVMATVISHQPDRNQVVIDAGALALSQDPGPTHLDATPNWGAIVSDRANMSLYTSFNVAAMSQEHGIIKGKSAADVAGLPVGCRVIILPNHSCLTAAQFDEYIVVEGERVVDRWKIQRERN
ncbi:MAG: alanine racemase [Candidatus Marinimicrobia bacterium]|nr:alanine racemase [Candidatus Neomarinimicrobiota bacterium]